MHENVHDELHAVTGEILAGEGEKGVLGLQVSAEAQQDSKDDTVSLLYTTFVICRNRL